MRVFPKLKSLSRAVHEEQERDHDLGKEKNNTACTSLTVWRKSLVMSCKGFTVIDSNGNLVYRVDNYIQQPNEVTLMDASGKSILTMCRRSRVPLNFILYAIFYDPFTFSSFFLICLYKREK